MQMCLPLLKHFLTPFAVGQLQFAENPIVKHLASMDDNG